LSNDEEQVPENKKNEAGSSNGGFCFCWLSEPVYFFLVNLGLAIQYGYFSRLPWLIYPPFSTATPYTMVDLSSATCGQFSKWDGFLFSPYFGQPDGCLFTAMIGM
jgi:hypothetical protein